MFVLHEISKARGGRVCAIYDTQGIAECAISCLCKENKYSDDFIYLLTTTSGGIIYYNHLGVLI